MPVEVSELQRKVAGWLRYYELDHDLSFHTAEEWNARGEKMCNDAVLHLTTEGELYSALNGWGEEGVDDRLLTYLEALGYYFEMGFAWSLHFYPLDDSLPVVARRTGPIEDDGPELTEPPF